MPRQKLNEIIIYNFVSKKQNKFKNKNIIILVILLICFKLFEVLRLEVLLTFYF